MMKTSSVWCRCRCRPWPTRVAPHRRRLRRRLQPTTKPCRRFHRPRRPHYRCFARLRHPTSLSRKAACTACTNRRRLPPSCRHRCPKSKPPAGSTCRSVRNTCSSVYYLDNGVQLPTNHQKITDIDYIYYVLLQLIIIQY